LHPHHLLLIAPPASDLQLFLLSTFSTTKVSSIGPHLGLSLSILKLWTEGLTPEKKLYKGRELSVLFSH
jgi:hypothetical protein